MLVEVEGSGWRRSGERVLAVQDRDANGVEDFADLKDLWLNVGAVSSWYGDEIVLENQWGGRG